MAVAGQVIDMQDGDCVVVEPREVHQMTNLSDQDAEYIVFGISSGQGGQTVVVDPPQG
jgi:mannose-6-phosphate isomerase-like protein (cupin superfamily)